MVGSRIGQYQVLRKLGQGAMGVVYLAHDASLDRDLALKFPSEDHLQSESARRRFMAEATAAAALDHPFICKIYETGEADGKPYIAMEHVTGVTLKDRLKEGRLPTDEVLQIALEVVEALECAHHHGLIHRDLKPSNIMISSAGHAKVMDFGLAKKFPGEAAEQSTTLTELTEAGTTVGTLAYMSPEQLRAAPLDARSDIFAMGIVLFEMLSGVHPFLRNTPVETATAILNDPPPALDAHLGPDAALWQHTLHRMLVKDRNQRYSSIHEVRTDLSEIRQALAFRQPQPRRTPTRRVFVRWGAVLGQIVLAAAVFIAYQVFWATPKTALAFQARDWILVTDFNNQTGEPVFDKSLRTALVVGIQQSSYVNVFPDARTRQTLRRMRKEKAEFLDENLASEVAIREGIKGLLACSISKVGDVYSISAQLVEPLTRAAAATQTIEARGQNEVLSALNTLAARVRERLGESMANIPGRVLSLPRATTSSLQALKAYSDGLAATGRDDRKSFQLLQHAVELDPDFALAHIQLGQDWYIRGQTAKAEPHFQKALSLVDRLTLRERLWVQAVVEDWRGNREQAVDRYKVYLAEYPDDSAAWFRIGWTQMATLRQYDAAIEAFQRVIKLDPKDSHAYINLATCQSSLEKYPEAIAFYEKAFGLNPEVLRNSGVNHEYGFTLVKSGDTPKARRTFESMLKLGQTEIARGHRSLALLDMFQGKYRSAVTHLREAVLLNKTADAKTSELRDRLFLASALRTMARTAELSAELNEIERMLGATRFAPEWVAMAGRLFHKAGRARAIPKLYAGLTAGLNAPALTHMNRSDRGDRASLTYLEGFVNLTKGRRSEALEAFESSLRIREENGTLDTIAATFTVMGKSEEALDKYLELTARQVIGHEGQEEWVLAHYEAGKLYEQRKETAKAREHYQRFLGLWNEADTDLKPVVDAQVRMKRL